LAARGQLNASQFALSEQVRAFATNNAGLWSFADSPKLQIVPPGTPVTSSTIAIIVAASVGLTSIIVALATIYIVRLRCVRRRDACHARTRRTI
jgi:hypothetical protein